MMTKHCYPECPRCFAERVELALAAIHKGRTMGQFLRDLPGSKKMTKEQLQAYSKAYSYARGDKCES